MSKKTIEHAAGVLKEIKAEVNNGVIKEHEIPVLCNMETGRETGFAVVLTLFATTVAPVSELFRAAEEETGKNVPF